MKAISRGIVIVGALLAVARPAGAQSSATEVSLGEAGHVALSAERLFGFAHSEHTPSMNGRDGATVTSNTVSLLGNPLGGPIGASYTFPRLSIDGFVANAFSIGAAATYFHFTQTTSPPAGVTGATDRSTSVDGFLLSPRLGFAAHLGPTVSLWARAGVTYLRYWSSSESGGKEGSTTTANLFSFTAELPLAFTITSRAAFLIGPTLDFGLSGGSTTDPPPGTTGSSVEIDNKETNIGLHASLMVLL